MLSRQYWYQCRRVSVERHITTAVWNSAVHAESSRQARWQAIPKHSLKRPAGNWRWVGCCYSIAFLLLMLLAQRWKRRWSWRIWQNVALAYLIVCLLSNSTCFNLLTRYSYAYRMSMTRLSTVSSSVTKINVLRLNGKSYGVGDGAIG